MFESSSGYYPNNPNTLEKDVRSFLKEHPKLGVVPKLVVSPEEGLSDCGNVYGKLYSALDFSKFNNVVIIGSPPVKTGPEISYVDEGFKTPLGEVEIDKNFTIQLDFSEHFEKRDDLFHLPFVEMQLIFLQVLMEDFKVVPIMIENNLDEKTWEKAVEKISEVLNPQDLLITCSNLATSEEKGRETIKKYNTKILNCLRGNLEKAKFKKMGESYNMSGWRSVLTGIKSREKFEKFHLFGHKIKTSDPILESQTTGFAGICFD